MPGGNRIGPPSSPNAQVRLTGQLREEPVINDISTETQQLVLFQR
jgi:hypothetical protein